jgi:hypothetical protein
VITTCYSTMNFRSKLDVSSEDEAIIVVPPRFIRTVSLVGGVCVQWVEERDMCI